MCGICKEDVEQYALDNYQRKDKGMHFGSWNLQTLKGLLDSTKRFFIGSAQGVSYLLPIRSDGVNLLLYCRFALQKRINGVATDIWENCNSANYTAFYNVLKADVRTYDIGVTPVSDGTFTQVLILDKTTARGGVAAQIPSQDYSPKYVLSMLPVGINLPQIAFDAIDYYEAAEAYKQNPVLFTGFLVEI